MTDLVKRLRQNAAEFWAHRYEADVLLIDAADEIERLRTAIDTWVNVRKAMMAGSAEGKPWSSESIAALGLAEAALSKLGEDK